MSLCAESSTVLAWLLNELGAAMLGELTEAEAADRRAYLSTVAAHWVVLRIGSEVVERARQPFPGEPIRTLDAIYRASLLVAQSAIARLALLSLDSRVRTAASRPGIGLLPS